MATAEVVRALNLLFSLTLIQLCYAQYTIPEVKIQVFSPKGFRASIPDAPNLGLFVFQGNINRAIGSKDVGSISGEVIQAKNGWWTFEDPNVELSVGDVINYYVFVSVNSAGYVYDNLNYTVAGLEDRSGTDDQILPVNTVSPNPPTPRPVAPTRPQVTPNPAGECRPTLTTIQGGSACAGQILFEDNFNSLQEDLWQVEQYIPASHVDYPFVSYQRKAVSVADGFLRITPSLQQKSPGFSNDTVLDGTLDLYSGCTTRSDPCYMKTSSADILPPVVTGRVITRQLAFTYGTVHVKAKLPKGDWLYPEILLEPLLKRYGNQNHASGLLKIACARGNKVLYVRSSNYGNQILYGGAIIDSNCREALLTEKKSSDGRNWGDDFHEYSLRWAPDRIILLVDGEEYARIDPPAGGLRSRLPKQCRTGQTTEYTSNIAPFDDPFFITLGVNAGGISEFKDGLFTEGDQPKPWLNQERKARLHFFRNQDAWYPTWTQPELLVDYVKVIAL